MLLFFRQHARPKNGQFYAKPQHQKPTHVGPAQTHVNTCAERWLSGIHAAHASWSTRFIAHHYTHAPEFLLQ